MLKFILPPYYFKNEYQKGNNMSALLVSDAYTLHLLLFR